MFFQLLGTLHIYYYSIPMLFDNNHMLLLYSRFHFPLKFNVILYAKQKYSQQTSDAFGSNSIEMHV